MSQPLWQIVVRVTHLGLAGVTVAALTACGGTPSRPDDGGTMVSSPDGQLRPDEIPAPPPVSREAKEVFGAAVVSYKSGNAKQAIDLFQRAIEADESFGAAYFNIGRIYEEQGDLKEAKRWYEQSAEKGKGFGDGLVNLGRIELAKGNKAEALALFGKAVQVEPFNGEAHLNLAHEARERRDYANAVKHVRTALKEDSQNVLAYEVLARVYYDLGRFELAKLVCLTGLDIAKTADLYNTLGLVHLKLDNVRLALAAFEDSLKVNAAYVPAHMNVGAITFNYRDYESSYRHFGEVVKQQPDNLDALLSKAVAARGLERLDEAEAGYKAVLAKDEAHVGARYNLGVLYQEYTQKLEEALKHYEAVLRYEQQDATLRKDVAQRIEAVRIQMKNMTEVEEMMRQQKAQGGGEG